MRFVSCLFFLFPSVFLSAKKNKTKTAKAVKKKKKTYMRVMVEDLTEKYCNEEYIRR